MARTFPASESLFIESVLGGVCQDLNIPWQLNPYIYMQKFITILRKADKQGSPQTPLLLQVFHWLH